MVVLGTLISICQQAENYHFLNNCTLITHSRRTSENTHVINRLNQRLGKCPSTDFDHPKPGDVY